MDFVDLVTGALADGTMNEFIFQKNQIQETQSKGIHTHEREVVQKLIEKIQEFSLHFKTAESQRVENSEENLRLERIICSKLSKKSIELQSALKNWMKK